MYIKAEGIRGQTKTVEIREEKRVKYKNLNARPEGVRACAQ